MGIPLGNLYRMLLYACELNPAISLFRVGAEKCNGFGDLAARLLVTQARAALSGTRSAHFTESHIVGDAPNGRIDFPGSVSAGLLAKRRIACYVEQVDYPSVLAALIARTCRVMLRSGDLTTSYRNTIWQLFAATENAKGDTSPSHLRSHSVVRRDKAAVATVNLCEIILAGNLLSTESVSMDSVGFGVEQLQRFRLFESFVRGFFAVHSPAGCKVGKRSYPWRELEAQAQTERLVPVLQPDVVVERSLSTLLIDAKCYEHPLDTRWGTQRFRSSHVCQMHAYLTNWQSSLPPAAIGGLLLYARVTDDFDHVVRIGQHAVRLATVDLAQPWPVVEARMMQLLDTGSVIDR